MNKIWKSNQIKIGALIILLLISPLIFMQSSYVMSLIAIMFVNIIAAMSLNLLVGYGGQISIGNAAFLSLGGYSVAILGGTLDLSFWIVLPLSGIITGLIGLLIGLPAVRLSDHFLAVVTLGFGLSIPMVLMNWETLTGGYNGMSVSRPVLFSSDLSFFYVIIIVSILITWLLYNILKGRIGRSFIAIRDSEVAAQAAGINVLKYKILMFVLSAFFTGLGGGLYAYWIGFVSPEDFHLTTSLFLLAMIVVGGLASIPGAIIGAIIFSLITHFTADYIGMNNIVSGIAVVLVILFWPKGAVSLLDLFKKKKTTQNDTLK